MRTAACLIVLFALLGCDGFGRERDGARLDRLAEQYQGGDLEGAAAGLEAYLEEYPRDELGWTILGHVCEDLDRDEQAGSAYATALEIDPECFQAVTGRGILFRKQGEYDAAMAAYRRALEIDPNYAQAFSSMTVIALARYDDAAAMTYAKRGYELDPEDPVIAANLAVAYHYYGDVENRDRMTKIAARLGYRNLEGLAEIYSGEKTVRD